MKIKSYKARNTEEALTMVRNDMGPAALIVQTRRIRQGGVFGVMGNDAVEVVAAVDDDQPARRPVGDAPAFRVLKPAPTAQPRTAAGQASTFRDLYDRLIEQGVLPRLARALVEETLCRYPSSAFAERFPSFAEKLDAVAAHEDVLQAVSGAVAKAVRLERATRPAAGPKVVVLVGPTGVGKTTTIAKLATIARMRHGLPTALATIDTYRIGAVDQLKTYAELLGVPLAVVRRPGQMHQVMESFSDRAVVFVDTAGRSPRDHERVEGLRPYLECLPHAETHLVVSCSAKYEDALFSFQTFSALPIRRLIFSKVDESASFGSIYNLAAESQVALSYMTVGQEVPDDIEVTTPARMAELLLKGGREREGRRKRNPQMTQISQMREG